MYKRKDGLFEAVRTYSGQRVYFRGKSQREVFRKIEEYEARKEESPSFESVADRWSAEHFETIEEGSVRSYAPALARAKAFFSDREISSISTQDCNAYLGSLRDLAQKTVKNHKAVLAMIFAYAVSEGLLTHNPCDRIRVSDKLKKSSREPLTAPQRAEILATKTDEFQLAFLILFTGCRLGEALALEYSDIDWKKGIIHITKAVHFDGNRPIIGKLKTEESRRDIPLLPQLSQRLKELNGTGTIIGGTPITKTMLSRRWEHWCREHGLAHPEERTATDRNRHTTIWKADIDRHQIRHEYATILWEAGIDVHTASRLMGHSNIQTTAEIYQHFRERMLNDATQKLTDFFESSQ